MSPRPLSTFSLQALSHESIKGPKMNKLENNLYGQNSSKNRGWGGGGGQKNSVMGLQCHRDMMVMIDDDDDL